MNNPKSYLGSSQAHPDARDWWRLIEPWPSGWKWGVKVTFCIWFRSREVTRSQYLTRQERDQAVLKVSRTVKSCFQFFIIFISCFYFEILTCLTIADTSLPVFILSPTTVITCSTLMCCTCVCLSIIMEVLPIPWKSHEERGGSWSSEEPAGVSSAEVSTPLRWNVFVD